MPPMRKSFVPQIGQTPWTAFFPFFIVMFAGVFMSLFALHLTQYAWTKFIALTVACPKSLYKRYSSTFLLLLAHI